MFLRRGEIYIEDEWLTFTEANEKLGKNRNYLQQLYKRKPEYFLSKSVKKKGNNLFIDSLGFEVIQYILSKNTKKWSPS